MIEFSVNNTISKEFIKILSSDSLESSYITSSSEFNLIKKYFKNEIKDFRNKELEEEKYFNLKKIKTNKKTIKLGIVNGFGNAIGSYIQGINSLIILDKLLKDVYNFRKIEFNLYIRSTNISNYFYKILVIIAKEIDINVNFYFLPVKSSIILKNDYIIDNSGYIKDINYNKYTIVDFFLYKYNIDFKNLQEPKNNHFLQNIIMKNIDKTFANEIKNLFCDDKTILIHPLSSTKLRNMPRNTAIKLIDLIIKSTDYKVITTVNLNYKNKNFIDISHISNKFFNFCYAIYKVDKIITVGTSTYHIAAAFEKETLLIPVVYSDIKNIKNYKNTKLYILPGLNKTPYFYKHKDNEISNVELSSIWNKIEYENVLAHIMN